MEREAVHHEVTDLTLICSPAFWEFTKVMEHWFWIVPESNEDMNMTMTAD